MRTLAALFFVSVLVGCDQISGVLGEKRIDASSPEALERSVSEIKQSLPEGERERFSDAVVAVSFAGSNVLGQVMSGKSADEIAAEAWTKVDGKTAAEVIALHETMLAERRAKEREQALIEISELEKELLEGEAARDELKKFEVVRSRFYLQEQKYSRPRPIIEITVKNGLSEAVSRAFFHGVVASPGRSVPWISEDFNYSIAGGLEPGETATWSLAPNQFSEWGTVEVPKGAVMTVSVEGVKGADDEYLYKYDEKALIKKSERLAELKKKYNQG